MWRSEIYDREEKVVNPKGKAQKWGMKRRFQSGFKAVGGICNPRWGSSGLSRWQSRESWSILGRTGDGLSPMCGNRTVTQRAHYATRSQCSSWEKGQGWGMRSQLLRLHTAAAHFRLHFSSYASKSSKNVTLASSLFLLSRLSRCGLGLWSILIDYSLLRCYWNVPQEPHSSLLTLSFSSSAFYLPFLNVLHSPYLCI